MPMHHITTVQATINGAAAALSASLVVPLLTLFPEYTPLVAISGMAGGLARMLAEREALWPNGLGLILSGGLFGIFLFPSVGAFFAEYIPATSQDPRQSLMTGAFLTGLLGMTFVLWLLDNFQTRAKRLKKEADDDPME